MAKALAFLAGLGSGYLKAEDKKADEARQAERERRDNELRDLQIAQVRQGVRDREDLQAAGAPMTVTPMQGPKTAAQAASEAASFDPTQATQPQGEELGYIAGATLPGARGFAQRGVAQEYADTQGTPEARRGRLSALAAQGNTLASTALRDEAQLRAADLQAQAAESTLKENKQLQAQREFARGVAGAIGTGGWQGFAKFATDQYNDDNQYTAIEDGKGGATVVAKGKDGKEIGRMSFASPEDAIMYSVGRADPAKWAEYKAGRDDKKAAQEAQQRGLDIQQQNADTNERYRRDLAENMRQQRVLEGQRIAALKEKQAAGGGPIQVGLKDMRDFEGDLDGYIKDQYPVKDGADAAERAQINAEATAKKALGSSLFRTNAAAGIPLTAGMVLQAMELAADRKNVRVAQVGGQAVEAVVVNGVPVIVSGSLQKRPAPTAAAPVPQPTAAAGRQVSAPPPVTPATAPPPVNPSSAAAQAARGLFVPSVGTGWK